MRRIATGICAAVVWAGFAQAQPVVQSLEADEARQGVASDGVHAYAIDN